MTSEDPFWTNLEQFGISYGVIFILLMLLTAGVVGGMVWTGWWVTNRLGSKSPFTKGEMAPGDLLGFEAVQKMHRFLLAHTQPENAPFIIAKAAVCRDSGRVLPNARNAFGVIHVGKEYLQLRQTGNWVAWKKLTPREKERLLVHHTSLKGYEQEELHADPLTSRIIGWKKVPETDLKLLIVQKPET